MRLAYSFVSVRVGHLHSTSKTRTNGPLAWSEIGRMVEEVGGIPEVVVKGGAAQDRRETVDKKPGTN